MGSFVPWLYYSFYCSPQPRLIYLSIVCVLGISAIIVAQWDRFATPKHRQTRAGRSSSSSPREGAREGFREALWEDPIWEELSASSELIPPEHHTTPQELPAGRGLLHPLAALGILDPPLSRARALPGSRQA